MPLYFWVMLAVIVVLLAILIVGIVSVNKACNGAIRYFVAPWVKGNFGKRDSKNK